MSGPRRDRTESPSPPPAPPAPSPAPPGPLAEEAIGFAFGRSPAPGPPPKVVPSSSNARLPTHRTNPPETSRSNRSPECTASPPTRQPIHPSTHAPPRGNTPAPQLTAPHNASCKQQQHTDRYFYGILSWHARFNKTPASRHTRFAILANGPQGCPTKPALLFPARGRVSDDPRAFLSASLGSPARPTASPTRPRPIQPQTNTGEHSPRTHPATPAFPAVDRLFSPDALRTETRKAPTSKQPQSKHQSKHQSKPQRRTRRKPDSHRDPTLNHAHDRAPPQRPIPHLTITNTTPSPRLRTAKTAHTQPPTQNYGNRTAHPEHR